MIPGMMGTPSRRSRRVWFQVASITSLILAWAVVARAAGEYPLTLTLDAQAKSGDTTVTSKVTIQVDRLMEESRRARVTDALEHGGYANFVNALRAIPAVGTIQLVKRVVDVRYAREQQDEQGRRLVLVGDRPLFFLGDATKARAGYALTIVELRFDAQGGVTGRMAGAARVKPTPEGGVTLDDYAEIPVQLSGRLAKP